jgi:hypothetical protein
MSSKLVHNDCELGLVEGTGDMLNEETECLLFLLCRHEGPRGRKKTRSDCKQRLQVQIFQELLAESTSKLQMTPHKMVAGSKRRRPPAPIHVLEMDTVAMPTGPGVSPMPVTVESRFGHGAQAGRNVLVCDLNFSLGYSFLEIFWKDAYKV